MWKITNEDNTKQIKYKLRANYIQKRNLKNIPNIESSRYSQWKIQQTENTESKK